MNLAASRKQWLLGSASLLLLVAALIGAISMNPKGDTQPELPPEATAETAPAEPQEKEAIALPEQQDKYDWIMHQLTLQDDVDAMLLAELHSGAYTLSEPLVVLDPYEISPLTALIVFTTPNPSQITIEVPGKDTYAAVSFSFDGYTTEHLIPVYGLYAATVNQVVVTAKTQAGKTTEQLVPIETQPLPGEFDQINTVAHLPQPEKYQPGFTFAYNSNQLGGKVAFDVNGEYRWYLQGPFDNKLNYDINGHMLLPMGNTHTGDTFFVEVNPLGKLFRVFHSPYGCHHDIEPYQENTVLITGSAGETIGDIIYEVDLDTGEIINFVDLKNVLQRTRIAPFIPYTTAYSKDWLHLNAIVKQGDDIIISSRHQSALVKLSWPEAEIAWISSQPEGYLPTFDAYILQPVGEDFTYHYAQHTPQILPDYDNNPDTTDILLFDNRWRLHVYDDVPGYSRMVQYRINEKDMTIEQIREYGEEQGMVLHSGSRSDADLLPNGNWLGTFIPAEILEDKTTGVSDSYFSVVYLEIDENNQPVWMVLKTVNAVQYSLNEYRSERMDIYNSTANSIGVGIEAKNLIPDEVVTKFTQHTGSNE